jgi:hypothetical protein
LIDISAIIQLTKKLEKYDQSQQIPVHYVAKTIDFYVLQMHSEVRSVILNLLVN